MLIQRAQQSKMMISIKKGWLIWTLSALNWRKGLNFDWFSDGWTPSRPLQKGSWWRDAPQSPPLALCRGHKCNFQVPYFSAFESLWCLTYPLGGARRKHGAFFDNSFSRLDDTMHTQMFVCLCWREVACSPDIEPRVRIFRDLGSIKEVLELRELGECFHRLRASRKGYVDLVTTLLLQRWCFSF